MKLERSIKIGEDSFTVKYSYFGAEEYFLNGEILEKKWNFTLSGQRTFNIRGHNLLIDICLKPKNYYCRAYLDGQLHTDELFPEFKKKLERSSEPSSPVKRLLVILIVAFAFLSIISQIKQNH